MKKQFLVIVILILITKIGICQIHSKTDERFELTSIMFALAGAQEYCQCEIPSYWRGIEGLAIEYDSLAPINFIRELRKSNAIGYNAVSSTADILEIKNGKISLKSQYDISKISEIDSRWTEDLFADYIKMLNIFYAESKFNLFFESHRGLYAVAEQRMDEQLKKVNMTWFESFYGKSLDTSSLTVYVSLTNGPSNYAVPSGILIGAGSDSEGNPYFGEGISLLIHEFGHHYTNPIFATYWPQMEAAAKKIYPYVEAKMLENAYSGAKDMMGEWLNNLFMLMYYKENDDIWLRTLSETYASRGFVWIIPTVDYMMNFYNNRNQYPTINDFMPQLVVYINELADNIESIIQDYVEKQPYVVDVSPSRGSTISGITEVVITFSEPMRNQNGFDYLEDENIKPMEFVVGAKWSEDGLYLTLQLDATQGTPNCLYGLRFLPWAFVSQRGIHLNDKNEGIVYKIIKDEDF